MFIHSFSFFSFCGRGLRCKDHNHMLKCLLLFPCSMRSQELARSGATCLQRTSKKQQQKEINQKHRVAEAQSFSVGATCESGGGGGGVGGGQCFHSCCQHRKGDDLTSPSSDGAGRPVSCPGVTVCERRRWKRCRCEASEGDGTEPPEQKRNVQPEIEMNASDEAQTCQSPRYHVSHS